MADEAAPAAGEKRKRKLPVTLIAVVGVSVIEAGAFFAAFKFMGSGPAPVHGAETHAVEAPPPTTQPVGVAEVPVLRGFRVSNDKTGVMYLYDLDVSVVVSLTDREKVEELVKQHAAEIGDRMARLMRGANERVLREDDLRVLRSQVQEFLAELTESEDLIQRVLIPRFVPIRSD